MKERLAERRELRRYADSGVSCGARHLQHDPADPDLLDLGVLIHTDELRDLPAKFLLVERIELLADLARAFRGFVAVPRADREQQLQKVLLHRGGDPPDHSEVEKSEPPVLRQEDVSGMRVRVEEPVDQDLLQIGLVELFGERGAVGLEPLERGERRDLSTEDEVHRQHARSRVVLDRGRNREPPELLQVLAQRQQVLGFLAVIELAEKSLAELVHHLLELVEPSGLGVPVEQLGDLGEGGQVFHDLLADAGSLDLDGDRAAVPQDCAMHLPERRGRERSGLEFRKRLRDADAELFVHDPLDFREREG